MTEQEKFQLWVFNLFDTAGFFYYETVYNEYYKEGEDDSLYASMMLTLGRFETNGFSKRGAYSGKAVSILSVKGMQEKERLEIEETKDKKANEFIDLQKQHLQASIKDLSPKRKIGYSLITMIFSFTSGVILAYIGATINYNLQIEQQKNTINKQSEELLNLKLEKSDLQKQIRDLKYTLKKQNSITPL